MKIDNTIYLSRDEHGSSIFSSNEKPELVNGVWELDLYSNDKMRVFTQDQALRLLGTCVSLQPCEYAEVKMKIEVKAFDIEGRTRELIIG